MRIIGGERRGHRLKTPPFHRVRPTADRVREAIFNRLGPLVVGRWVADLFAGTGAMGLEALSRGAAFATFVEKDARVLRILRANVQTLGYVHRTRIVGQDVFRAAPKWIGRGKGELIFADPPYRQGYVEPLLSMLGPLITEGSWIVLEHAPDEMPEATPASAPLECVDRRRYGDTMVSWYHAYRPGRMGHGDGSLSGKL